MDYTARARDVLDIEIEGLRKVRDGVADEFAAAIGLMMACLERRGKIVVTGIGKSLHVGQKISATLASTGATSVVLNPSQAVHGDLGILCPDDVLLALSYSGESEELLALVPQVKRRGIPIVAVTGVPNSALARLSDIVLAVTVDREACPFNMAPTSSTTVTMAMGDALAMVLLEARGFEREDYAQLHPGGAIGRALLTRVADIMRTGPRLAVVNRDATVRDAVLAMTQARAGSAAITDGENHLEGILTDGDLRRGLAEHDDLLTLPVSRFMTRSPLSVTQGELAVDVLRVFEKHDIDDIPVVDEENRVVGAVDIVDLPKAKVM